MDVEPAHIDQIRRGARGAYIEIDKDVGGVAEDLRRIDPHLKVRFAENGNPPFFAIRYESDDGRETYLVMTVQAFRTASGTWAGLDQRVVKRIEQIGHESYDYPAEVERQTIAAREARRDRFRQKIGDTAERAAHALRKDLGTKYKGRIFT